MADPNCEAGSSTPLINKQCQVEPVASTSSASSSKPCSSSGNNSECSSSTGKMDKELLSQALQAMQHGKRHMIVNDYKSAVPCFETATEFLGQCYGLKSLECAEAYLYYGTALYEMSRLEEGLDGGIVNVENPAQSDDDEQDDEEDDEEGDEEGNEPDADGEKDENGEEENEEENEVKIEDVTAESNMNVETLDQDINCQPSTSKGEPSNVDGEKSDDENGTDIEIAFEVLMTAKEIYQSNLTSKENRLNYAETLQKLGEISIDWENVDTAIEFLEECLEHRKSTLDQDDRLIAVTYHYLGLAFSFKCDADRSNICFQKALDVIQLRIDNLKAKDVTKMDIFEKASHESEILQLESLIPEIRLKIGDMKEQVQSRSKTLITMEKEKEQDEAENKELIKEKPINNVTHLIKRKREPDNGNDQFNDVNNKKLCLVDLKKSSTTNSSENTSTAITAGGESSNTAQINNNNTNSNNHSAMN